ncbi:unnamed protein product [Boreogadus saida]
MAAPTVLLLLSALWLRGAGSESPPPGGGSPAPPGPGPDGSPLEGGTWDRPLLEAGGGPTSALDGPGERNPSGRMTQAAVVMETGRLPPRQRPPPPGGVAPARGEDPAPWRPAGRRRRSWLWNQFFVIEEYRGPEPVLIGRQCLQEQRAGDAISCNAAAFTLVPAYFI